MQALGVVSSHRVYLFDQDFVQRLADRIIFEKYKRRKIQLTNEPAALFTHYSSPSPCGHRVFAEAHSLHPDQSQKSSTSTASALRKIITMECGEQKRCCALPSTQMIGLKA
jgi:hypothetical protein